MITFRCDHCGNSLTVPDASAGKSGECPHCGNSVNVPNTPGATEGYGLKDPLPQPAASASPPPIPSYAPPPSPSPPPYASVPPPPPTERERAPEQPYAPRYGREGEGARYRGAPTTGPSKALGDPFELMVCSFILGGFGLLAALTLPMTVLFKAITIIQGIGAMGLGGFGLVLAILALQTVTKDRQAGGFWYCLSAIIVAGLASLFALIFMIVVMVKTIPG